MRSILLGLVLSVGLATHSAASEGSAADRAFFEKKIRPLLDQHCLKCHSEQARASGKLRGGLLLDSAEGWKQVGTLAQPFCLAKPPKACWSNRSATRAT